MRYIHFTASYDRNNYNTKKQPHNLQTTFHGVGACGWQLVDYNILYKMYNNGMRWEYNNVKYNIEKNHIIINLSLIASLEHNDTQ